MTLYFTEIDGTYQSAEVTKVILYLKDEIEKRDIKIEQLTADNLDLRRDETLNEAEAEIERLRKVLHQLACLGNGDTYGNSIGNEIAIRALGGK
jgi:hypothetical protein